MRRARYQRGSLRFIRRKDGGKLWEYRWRKAQTDSTRKRRSMIVGSLEDYPSESIAQTAVDSLRLNINLSTQQVAIKDISVKALGTTTESTSCRTSFLRKSRRESRKRMSERRGPRRILTMAICERGFYLAGGRTVCQKSKP